MSCLQKFFTVPRKDEILLLFSGGQDSTGLTFLLLLKSSKKEFLLVHINEFVQVDNYEIFTHIYLAGLYLQLPIIFTIFPKNFLLSNEMKLREKRYNAGKRISNFYQIANLFTAHTKTDLIETYLLNFYRGTFLNSVTNVLTNKILLNKTYHTTLKKNLFHLYPLKSESNFFFYRKLRRTAKSKLFVKVRKYEKKTRNFHYLSLYKKNISVLKRPLKDLKRKTIQKLNHNIKSPIYYDQTNKLLDYNRNRIRYHLIGYIAKFLNSDFENSLNLSLKNFNVETQVRGEVERLIKQSVLLNRFDVRFLILDKKNFQLLSRRNSNFLGSLNISSLTNLLIKTILSESQFSNYLLVSSDSIYYVSTTLIKIEIVNWVTWDSNPELIG